MSHVSEKELDSLRAELDDSPTIQELNKLAADIVALRDREKEMSDAKSLVTKELEEKETKATNFLLEHSMTSYRAPSGLLSVSFRTSVRQPQAEQVLLWLETLKEEFSSLEGAVQAGMLSTNSMKLNSWYKEKLELAREAGQSDLKIKGLTEIKMNPSLSFRRTR